MKILDITTNDKVLTYKLTKDASIQPMKESAGAVFKVKNYALYEDEKDGETATILSIMDEAGVVRATNSSTFQREFKDIMQIADGDEATITVVQGTTKSNREFITCSLVDITPVKKK